MDIRARIDYHFRRREFVLARRLGEALLALEAATDEEKAYGALMAAESAYQLDDVQAAIMLARRAVNLAEAISDAETCGRAWFRLIGAYIMAGDAAEAQDAADRFLEGLQDRWPDLEPELGAKALQNLAMLQRNQRRYPEALQAYWQALVRFQRQGHALGELSCRQEMAWLLTRLGDLEAADEHLQAAAQLLTPEMPTVFALYQLTHEAYLRVQQGQLTEAVELAEEVLAPGRPDVTEGNRAVAYMVTGMATLRTGSASAARIWLKLATEAAVKSGLSAMMNLVQELAREIRVAEGA